VSEGIERNVRLPAPPKRVWEALTEEDQLSAWIGWDAEIDAHPGGAVRFGAAGGTRMRGIVSVAEPPHRLSFRWRELSGAGPSLRIGEPRTVEFVLEHDGDGTLLTVTESAGLLGPEEARVS